jgi:hypothetical protein
LTKEIYTNANPVIMKKRIGSTIYEVNGYFNPDAKETAEEKLLRIIKNDLKFCLESGIIKVPQTGVLSERSSA